MTITLSLLLCLLSIVGVVVYRLLYSGRVKAVNDALTIICVSGVATMLSCALFTLASNETVLFTIYTVYYIFYALTIYAFTRFSYIFCTGRKIDIFTAPLFYGTILCIAVMLWNLLSHEVFTLSTYDFAGVTFPMTVHSGIFIFYMAYLVLESVIACVYVVITMFKSASLYKPRYVYIILVILFHLSLEFISYRLRLPAAIKSCFLLPEGLLLAYICSSYTNRKLTMSVLNHFMDNTANGLMIYDENDYLMYHNNRIEDILTHEQMIEFNERKHFDEWASDLEEFNDIFIKSIKIKGKTRYYNIYKHSFTDKDAYIGTSYQFQDITESFERFAMIEEANEELKRVAHMKSDFLANMSHEIRTPMNVVIGLAEMSLREDMTDQAREYISQIKSSGRNLLNIINDILDFSKIESGKMDIIPEDYEPLSEFNDVANILMTRIGDKDLELTMEENPAIPGKLYGDVLRIRQILINLANNAIKFTQHGRVQIIIDFVRIDDESIMLKFHVVDTGQGIKKEDLNKLFVSFQQVDSKRNRAIEGTGLGLAISKSLVETMGGSIGVNSEYGKGSDFYFEIPQKVVDWTPSVVVESPDRIFAMGLFHKKYLARRFFLDCSRMGVFNVVLRFVEDYEATCSLYGDVIEDRRKYLFFEEKDYKDKVRELLLGDPDLIGVMLAENTSSFIPDLKNLRMIKKPFSTVGIALALNNLELHLNNEDGKAYVSDFTAPSARVLIVDDNTVNLTVAEGLLEPLKMKIDCAVSGKQAIEMINVNRYDIVFMDHMMPEMDGVETTHIIRRMYPDMENMPIIALTANAVSGVKEYFLREGMNDFVPKPIEVRDLMSKVKQWLPPEKINKVYEVVSAEEQEEELNIPGLEVKRAVAMIGSQKLYMKILTEYYKNIGQNYAQLEEAYSSKDWSEYTIKIHALKSASRQIGAIGLSEEAAKLEDAGKAGDIDYIIANSSAVLGEYMALEPVLKNYCSSGERTEKGMIPPDMFKDILNRVISASDDLDMDAMEGIVEELRSYEYDPSIEEDISKLIESAEIMDVFTCSEIAAKLLC